MITADDLRDAEGKPRTWQIEGRLEKYDESDIDVWTEKRRLPGLKGHLRRRQRVTCSRAHAGAKPKQVITSLNNLLLNAGIQRLEDLLIVAGGQGFDATHSRIGVGNSSTAAAATQTDLQAAAGAGNRQFKLCDQGPTRASQTITWRITMASGEGNFAWSEWGIDVGTADGTTVAAVMLNRKVFTGGTKASGAVWVFTVTLTIS